ncbi:MAG: LLM class flavin-dependent oxidoreductase [Acidimicrobiia bacterium]|nr:LLM class flavin-dependent oxidoreductase [Acidimicrobiia bacterium]
MKFAVLQFFSWPQRRVPITTVYERALERIDVMDRGGYDAVWLAEHHFSGYSVCPSVHLMGMHVADRTTNLRIGMGVTLAAFYHPLRIAEEIALLDVLSGGRVNWGAGRGFDRTEYAAFDVTEEQSYPRFREAVDIVLAAWRNERLTYHSDNWHFDDVEVLPKPLQEPHPPTWIASSSAPAVEWSARNGHAILMDPHSGHREIGAKLSRYAELRADAGFGPQTADTPIARLLAIAPTDAEAEAVARQGASWMVGSYANPERSAAMRGVRVVEDPIQRYVDDVIIWGTPERVADRLLELEETMPLRYLLAAPLSHATFLALTDEVIPRLS